MRLAKLAAAVSLLAGALLTSSESAKAQFGISVGFGSPGYYGYASPWWGGPAVRTGFSWGGPVLAGYASPYPAAYPVSPYYYEEPVVVRRVVRRAPVYYAPPVRTRIVAAPVYRPRQIVRQRTVVYRAPGYRPHRVVRRQIVRTGPRAYYRPVASRRIISEPRWR